MRSYSEFNVTPDHAYNIRRALEFCRAAGEDGLCFPYGSYELYESMASEKFYTMSNHGCNNLKRIAFLLEGMENFTIDGGGSLFFLHDGMMGFSVDGCRNVTVRNLTVDTDSMLLLTATVTKVLDGGFEAEAENDRQYVIEGGKMRMQELGYDLPVRVIMIRGRDGGMEFPPHTSEAYTRDTAVYTAIGERAFRVENCRLGVKEGDLLTLRAGCRHSSNFYLKDSENTRIENVTLHRSMGMGVIAEKCTDITLDGVIVTPPAGSTVSLDADATHFVHCRGRVTVENCRFEGQMDDALNIHGVFTRILAVEKDAIFVRYMHPDARGLGIYEAGSRFRTVNPRTCIPCGEYTVKSAEALNIDVTRIEVEGGTDGIEAGMNIEDLTWTCSLVFRNNIVRDNRARGMLIAAYGDVLIEKNTFHTAGCSILFESDGEYWFESGGTNHVVIRENHFDRCKYAAAWGKAIIAMMPRKEFDGEHNYHGYIEVSENRFTEPGAMPLSADNAAELAVRANVVTGTAIPFGQAKNCGCIRSDVPLAEE